MKTFLFFLSFLYCSYLHSQSLQWRLLPNSPTTTLHDRFEDIFFVNENTGWIIHFDSATYKTTDGGTSWTRYDNHVARNRSIGFFNANEGIIGTLDSAKLLLRTTNGGINYAVISNSNLPSPKPYGICGISIVNENLAYACGSVNTDARVIKTTNRGVFWTSIFSDTSLARTFIDCYFWTPDSGIVVGGYNTSSFLSGNAVVVKTTNGGSTWQRVHLTSRTEEWCWKISFISRNIGFVSIERLSGFSYFLKTTDNGNNWTDLPFLNYDQEGIGFVNENTGWIGGSTGPTYQTTNGGTSWQLAGWGSNVNRFRFLTDTLAYAVGQRVYKYSTGPIGINVFSSEVPEKFLLQQNYPNPFNPETKIKFDITQDVRGETQDVRLLVYDALGKEVAALVNQKLSPGNYEVEFDGSNLSSGIYFYKLITDNFSEVKRMILLK